MISSIAALRQIAFQDFRDIPVAEDKSDPKIALVEYILEETIMLGDITAYAAY